MIYDYAAFKEAPEDIHIIVLFKFLGKLKNAHGPSDVDSDLPPVVFWWFEERDEKVNAFIKEAVNNSPWEEEWIVRDEGNNKWLLFPKRILEVEKMLRGVDDDNIAITRDGSEAWLAKNDPDFGRRTNRDLVKFTKYFRKKIEEYLKEKEQAKILFFKNKKE